MGAIVLKNECDVRTAFDKAPHLPVAGTSPASAFAEEVHVDLLFLDNSVALHAMDPSPRNSILVLVAPKIRWERGVQPRRH